jgi:hypothetical protein
VDTGATITVVKDLTGHKSDTVVQHYIAKSAHRKTEVASGLSTSSCLIKRPPDGNGDDSSEPSDKKRSTNPCGTVVNINLSNVQGNVTLGDLLCSDAHIRKSSPSPSLESSV